MITICIVVYLIGVVSISIYDGYFGPPDVDVVRIVFWPLIVVIVALCYTCSAPYNFGKYLARRKKNND